MTKLSWLNDSGGLVYHWRALRYSKSYWSQFRDSIGRWLEPFFRNAIESGANELIIFGSSGGYTLSESWLQGFEKILIFEPDPIARWIFRRRLSPTILEKVFFSSSDVLVTAKLKLFLDQHPRACILFSNVLGQLHLLDEKNWNELRCSFAQLFEKRCPWISYHDRVSGEVRPKISQFEFSSPLSNEALLENFFPPQTTSLSVPAPELIDHQTFPLVAPDHPPLRCAYFEWNLTPGSWHVIEAISSPSS